MNHPLLPSSSSFSLDYLIDQDHDHHHHNNHFFYLNPQPSSSLANSIFFVSSHHQQQQFNVLSSSGGSFDHASGLNNLEIKTEDSCDSSPMKWMSAEMRMRNSDQIIEHNSNSIQSMDHNNNDNVTIRVCSDCNTTKTPLWRSGPRGPKSLCNACGIRQRKARRAIAEASDEKPVATVHVKSSCKLQCKNRRCSNDQTCLPIKKRFKITSPSSQQQVTRGRKKKICFEDLPIILSKNSTFQQVFPQDEREAAILLMSLSYGLVHG